MPTIMIPVLPAASQGTAIDKNIAEPASESFSEYLEKKRAAENREENNLLGTKRRPENKNSAQSNVQDDKDTERARKNPAEASLAGALNELMLRLKDIAEEIKTGPGEWTFAIADPKVMEQLCKEAGMSDADISLLLQQMEGQNGKIELADFLSTLARHFERQSVEKVVTVPETDLPLLETFLSRMGVSVEDISRISSQAVTGDGRLDLGKFLQGLEDYNVLNKDNGVQLTTLTNWEAEQLRDILAKAGVSETSLRSLLPERPQHQFVLSYERLSNLLLRGLNDIENNRLKPDLRAFLTDLDKLFAESGFEKKTVGWSPVVQETVEKIYADLLKSVDLSTVRVEAGKSGGKGTAGNVQDMMASDTAEGESDSWFGASDGPKHADISARLGKTERVAAQRGEKQDLQLDSDKTAGEGAGMVSKNQTDPSLIAASGTASGSEDVSSAAEQKAPVSQGARLSFQLYQQTFENITQGVIRGLNKQEHHLVLRLYPKELGEVKVEMMVRNDHVAISFSMENAKVKDILESNMQQFQDNLAKQGFILKECMVSLGQREDQSEAWRQFAFDWKNKQHVKRESLADLGDDIFYVRSQAPAERSDGVDLFA